VYSVKIDGDQVMVVEVQKPAWLPINPAINQPWLRSVLVKAIQAYTRRKAVVKV
jgi:hypothetical protein